MKHFLRLGLTLAVVLGLVASSSVAEEKLTVVTTVPDLADIAERIGGERVSVLSLAKGTQNIHRVQVRPTHLARMNKADLFLQMGLSLEHAYVPGLLENARNPRIQPGAPGFVNCSEGWKALEVPERVSRADGADIHPLGNPHFNLDPAGGQFIADRVLEGFVRVQPSSADYFRARHAAYTKEIEAARKRWAEHVEKFRGKKIVTYHKSFSYFAHATGLEIVGMLEPKPGVPPTPSNLARTIGLIEREGVTLILTAKWSNNKNVRFVADRTGAKVLEIPVMVGGVGKAASWIGMMDYLHRAIAEHYDPDRGPGPGN